MSAHILEINEELTGNGMRHSLRHFSLIMACEMELRHICAIEQHPLRAALLARIELSNMYRDRSDKWIR